MYSSPPSLYARSAEAVCTPCIPELVIKYSDSASSAPACKSLPWSTAEGTELSPRDDSQASNSRRSPSPTGVPKMLCTFGFAPLPLPAKFFSSWYADASFKSENKPLTSLRAMFDLVANHWLKASAVASGSFEPLPAFDRPPILLRRCASLCWCCLLALGMVALEPSVSMYSSSGS